MLNLVKKEPNSIQAVADIAPCGIRDCSFVDHADPAGSVRLRRTHPLAGAGIFFSRQRRDGIRGCRARHGGLVRLVPLIVRVEETRGTKEPE